MRRAAYVGSLSVLSAVSFTIACTGGTCGTSSDSDYRFPQSDPQRPDAVIQQDVVRVRLTQAFLDFAQPRLPDLLRSRFDNLGEGIIIEPDGRLRITIPDQELVDIGVGQAEIREAEATLYVDDLEDRIAFALTAPNGAQLSLNRLRVGIDLKFKQDLFGIDSSCPASGGLNPHAAEVSVTATIDPAIGPRPDYALDLNVDVDQVQVNDFGIDIKGPSRYCSEPECADCDIPLPFGGCLVRCGECELFCGGLLDVAERLVNALSGPVADLLNSIIQPIIDDLIREALGSLEGAPAKVEAQFDLTDATGLTLFGRAQPFGVFAAPQPGPLEVNDRGAGLGMELAFDAGLEAAQADCVAELPAFVPERGPAPALSGLDRGGRPYHLGFTLSASYLNQALYTAHRSGALCLRVDSDDIRDLSGGTFSLNASVLALLAPDLNRVADRAAPVILELKPRHPGVVTLGSGDRTGEDEAGHDIFDWLLQVEIADIGVALHVLIEDRYVRLFEVTTDVFVGLNVEVLPDNSLQVVLGDIETSDFQERFNELLPNADFAEVLPVLLDVALGAVLSEALVFDFDLTEVVSDALGGTPVFLQVNDIFRDGSQQDFLTMSVTFRAEEDIDRLRSVDTRARVHPTQPGLLDREPVGSGAEGSETEWQQRQVRPAGSIRLVVGETLTPKEQGALEYQVQVDGGIWTAWQTARPDGTLHAFAARLKVPGWHTVAVRARRAGEYRTLDPTPVTLRVLVDPLPPQITARPGDQGIEVRVRDVESEDSAALQLEMRTTYDGTWQPVAIRPLDDRTAGGVVPYAELANARQVMFRARDASGNPTRVLNLDLDRAEDGRVRSSATQRSICRCAQAPVQSTRALPWMLLVGVFLMLRRLAGR